MTINKNTDLGASFDRLKKAMNEGEELRGDNTIDGLTSAYARLYTNVEYFVNTFDDPEPVPTLERHLNNPETKDDIPENLYRQTPGIL